MRPKVLTLRKDVEEEIATEVYQDGKEVIEEECELSFPEIKIEQEDVVEEEEVVETEVQEGTEEEEAEAEVNADETFLSENLFDNGLITKFENDEVFVNEVTIEDSSKDEGVEVAQ